MKRIPAAVAILTISAAPALSAEPWEGRWSIDPAGCTRFGDAAHTAPLIVTAATLKWFTSSCRVGKIYKTGQDAHIQAHCWAEGKSSTIPISLKPRGDRLTVIWDNAPTGEMRRCK